MSDENPAEKCLSAALQRLAFPQSRQVSLKRAAQALPFSPSQTEWSRSSDVALVTICTVSHLPYARLLGESLERYHPEIDFYVVVTDWEADLESGLGRGRLIPVEALGIDRLDFLRLKLSAAHFCYAIKPPASRFAAELGYSKVLYVDSDIEIYSPLTVLLEALDRHRFVVTPHIVAPFFRPERHYEHPNLGDLAEAGVFNAGLYGFVPDGESHRFLDSWQEMVLAPGSFLDLHQEQNSFNWVTGFLDGVFVLRDTAYNVAYWNLHDRSLRWCGFDGGEGYQVDGKPLVTFHFSGLPFERPAWLSVHDSRYSLYILPSVARLIEGYTERLMSRGLLEARERTYRYDRFPSGVPIDERMRRLLRQFEVRLWRDIDPFSPEGEQYYGRALLQPVPGTYMVPLLLWGIHQDRPEIQMQFPELRVRPQRIIQWFCAEGAAQMGYTEMLDHFRPTFAKREAALHLDLVRERLPVAFADLEAPLSADRQAFIRRLEQAGLVSEANGLRGLDAEIWSLSPLSLIRELIHLRPDLQQNFPDLFAQHAEYLADWLEGDGVANHGLPPGLGEIYRAKAHGRSVARVYSFYRRSLGLMEAFPFAFVGEGSDGLATALLESLDCEFDFDDVVMFQWVMEKTPWIGVAATLETPVHAGFQPSPLLPEGQDRLLGPFFARAPGFRQELERYRKAQQERRGFAQMRRAAYRLGHSGLLESVPHPILAQEQGACKRGVNCFGYFKSPIGLGSLSEGLALALNEASYEVARNVHTNMAMARDLCLDDLLNTYRYDFDTNIFVSYPHLHHNLLKAEPPAVGNGRRNIVYLAWEQRDFHHWWREVYKDFDQVWALSSFAAEAIGKAIGREVLALPAVVDFSEFPPPASKLEVGLEPDLCTFLYVFDANSSIERKNPSGAIEAFGRAFAPGEPVELLIKASNAGGLQHRRELLRLKNQAARTGLRIRFVTDYLPRQDLMRLMSAVDCYVSLHRSEGFGYTCAESMSYGVPVIATNYSGNLDFMDEQSSYLVRAGEIEVMVPDGPFQRGSIWGDPDLDHAAELMRQVFEQPAAAREVGARGSRLVREKLSVARIGAIVKEALG